jgi:hypothetical protein
MSGAGGLGRAAGVNAASAQAAAVRAVTPGARSQDTKTIVDFLRKRQAGKRFAKDQADGSPAPSL